MAAFHASFVLDRIHYFSSQNCTASCSVPAKDLHCLIIFYSVIDNFDLLSNFFFFFGFSAFYNSLLLFPEDHARRNRHSHEFLEQQLTCIRYPYLCDLSCVIAAFAMKTLLLKISGAN
mmetsp:Transcript_11708/g.16376  ORF Transcript_11708/g.16376 Transcript_11708/m.16376 type:complete len:118 (-) Transcript_11708:1388-1741(-)